MHLLLSLLAAAAQPQTSAPPTQPAPPPKPLTTDQAIQLRCVAALAIVANEQDRGAEEWADFPLLASRGAHFAGVVGQSVMKQSGRSREQVRDAILAEVAAFQKQYSEEAGIPRQRVTSCIALMDQVDPPLPPPTLVQCTALVGLAAKQVEEKEGMSVTASRLAVYAALLEDQARAQLRAEGKTENEGDVVLGLAREKLIADTGVKRAKGEDAEQDFETCFTMAKAPKEPHKGMNPQ